MYPLRVASHILTVQGWVAVLLFELKHFTDSRYLLTDSLRFKCRPVLFQTLRQSPDDALSCLSFPAFYLNSCNMELSTFYQTVTAVISPYLVQLSALLSAVKWSCLTSLTVLVRKSR